MIYNSFTHKHYLTNAERLALDITKYENGSIFKEVDTKNEYILYEGTWYLQ